MADAAKQTVSTLLDIKVLPKTMTHDYESWWRVGSSQVANKKKIIKATGGWLVVEAEQDPDKANPLEYAIKARKYILEKTGL